MIKNETHIIESSILKPYDIRGIVDKTLNSTDAYFIGKGYGTLLQKEKNKHSCIVGYDGRHTSKNYAEETIKGLIETGINVVCIELAPTPMVYFGLQFLHLDAGIIITASHNPPEYNGFKFLTNEEPVWDKDIQKIGEYAKNGDFFIPEKLGTLIYRDIKENYVNFIARQLEQNKYKILCECSIAKKINKGINYVMNLIKPTTRKELNIVWDAGNGAMAFVMKEIIAKIPGTHTLICDTVNGDFPNHHPDPSVESNMKMLKAEVKKQNADLGIAFDGDGDRVGVIDSEGQFFFGDQLLDIMMRPFLKEHPGEKIIFEMTSSQVLIDDIKKYNGIPVMWKPGHSTIKAKMKSDNIQFGGETTGHFFYGENYGYDDGFYSAMKLINYLSTNEKTLNEMRKEFPKTFATEKIKIYTPDDKIKYVVPAQIAERLKQQGREVIEVEGARVPCGNGWWMIRSSNTEPMMTSRCEAMSEEGLENCKRELKEQLNLSNFDIVF